MFMKAVAATPAAGDEVEALTAAACMFKSLGDPTRLAIVQHLALGEHRVVDMTAHLGLAQSTVSAHLACLKDCDLVASRPVGRASMFSLKHPELLDLLRQAEVLLGVTRDAVTLCPTFGAAAAELR
ncbi:ArsR/SmtB family transcription factor [Flexivirga alba]|uniref:ArsR/SmtB family transcription factor n=1 Tax=Flexivirga alba TaxID=702742 RepID=A0ABW2AIE7_9MICO